MKLYDDQGNEIDAQTADEVTAALTAKQKELEDAHAVKLKELEDRNKELEGDVNPKWREFRQEYNKMKKVVEEKGIKVEEDKFTREEILKEAAQTAEKTLLTSHKNRLMSTLDGKTRPVVEKYFEKLTMGEEITLDNVESFVVQAEQLANPGAQTSPYRRAMSGMGRPPMEQSNEKTFDQTDAGKGLASKFGIDIS